MKTIHVGPRSQLRNSTGSTFAKHLSLRCSLSFAFPLSLDLQLNIKEFIKGTFEVSQGSIGLFTLNACQIWINSFYIFYAKDLLLDARCVCDINQ